MSTAVSLSILYCAVHHTIRSSILTTVCKCLMCQIIHLWVSVFKDLSTTFHKHAVLLYGIWNELIRTRHIIKLHGRQDSWLQIQTPFSNHRHRLHSDFTNLNRIFEDSKLESQIKDRLYPTNPNLTLRTFKDSILGS